jgi:uncharacterized membrane protein YfcA
MTIFLIALVVTSAGFINSLTGFGFIIIAAPFLIQLLPPKEAASIALVLGIILTAVVTLRERKTIAIKVVLQMFVAAIFGIPVGTALLVGMNPAAIKVTVGSIVVGVTIALTRGVRLPTSREFPLSLAAGFLSGILSGISGMSGAIAAIFFMSEGWPPERVRPTIACFNLIVSLVTILWLFSTGIVGQTECIFSLTFLPAVALGIALSSLVYKKIQTRYFRPLTFFLIIVAGILAIIAGIRELIW